MPGKSYLYTTHGWTLISAVIEKVAKQDFLEVMKKLFKDLGLKNTCADFNEKIIHNRARYGNVFFNWEDKRYSLLKCGFFYLCCSSAQLPN